MDKAIEKIHIKYRRRLTEFTPINAEEYILITARAPIIFLMRTEVTNRITKVKSVIRTGVTGKVAGWRGKKQIDTAFIKVARYPDPFSVRTCEVEEKGKTHWGFPFDTRGDCR